MMLTVDEQRQEFAVLRAVGAKTQIRCVIFDNSKLNFASLELRNRNIVRHHNNSAYLNATTHQ